MSQQEYLRSAKATLGVSWDGLARLAGINPRALKTYRLPDTSRDFRHLPSLARQAIDALVSAQHGGPDFNRGFYCAVAALIREGFEQQARSLFTQGGNPLHADDCDIELFRRHGLL